MLDIGKVDSGESATAAVGLARLKEVKEYIKQTVAAAFRKLRDAGNRVTTGRVNQVVSAALRRNLPGIRGIRAMKLICAPKDYQFKGSADALDVVLYAHADRPTRGSAGAAITDEIARRNLYPAPQAWDFLSLALAVTAADLAGHRTESPDGWTREFELRSRRRRSRLLE